MMPNFSIFTQIKNELNDFYNSKVRIAGTRKNGDLLRYAKKSDDGYMYNQFELLTLIDLYWNSKFEDGQKDKLNQTKIFMNVGKFRTEVASKQIALGTKNFKFFPDDYADPYTAIFMNKDFKEWAKSSYFAEEINKCEENFPKYGSVVLKQCGKELHYMPLQLLRNDQTADCLDEASYVIEEHPDMTLHEIQEMKEWDSEGLKMKFGEKVTVYERYGYVPLVWLKKIKGEKIESGDENISVDSLVIISAKNINSEKPEGHIFYAEQIDERPYYEAHWNKQHGRWLGIGEMENQLPNQIAKNIVINLLRRSLHWSSKRAFKTNMEALIGKSLAKDFKDGEFIEVGTNGILENLDMSIKSLPEFGMFMNEFEKNSDQKAFTYEVATGESLPSNTPFRLGVILSNAVNSHFKAKQERLGLLFKRAAMEFLVPQFLKDMSNKEKTLAMFSGEAGFEVLKEAATQFIRSEAAKISLFSGQAVDAQAIEQIVQPFNQVQTLFFTIPKNKYNEYKYRFDLDLTGESSSIETKLESLKALHEVLAATGDPRAEAVLARIANLTGEPLSQFGAKPKAVVSPLQPGNGLPANNMGGNGKGSEIPQ